MVVMINKKLFFTVVVSTILTAGIPMCIASMIPNDLLRMDIKKSSVQDTVDVTFYTTGAPANTVVTRKTGNTYVVLLPNVTGNQSIVPSLGGVKDLLSDVVVKNVDDGIGGYTKVTFTTTRPLKIQTSTKQTAPLSSAQQGYKNLIAQSANIKPISNTSVTPSALATKPAAQTASQKTAQTHQAKVKETAKPQTSSQKSSASNTKQAVANVIKTAAVKPAPNTVKANNSVNQPQAKTSAKTAAPKSSAKVSQPKSEVKQSQPKTSNKVETKSVLPKTEAKVQPAKPVVQESAPVKMPEANVTDIQQPAEQNVVQEKTNNKKVSAVPLTAKKSTKTSNKHAKSVKHSKYHNPIIPIAAAFCLFGIFLLTGLAGIITKGVEDKRNRLKEYLDNDVADDSDIKNPELQAIADDKNANWQEKYKRYTKVKESQRKIANRGRMSYVANTKSSKGVVVPELQPKRDKMQETISRMEHSYAQTPASMPSEDFSTKYRSEDNAIANKMSEVKLKSFAKSVSLTHSERDLVSFEELASRKKTLKEGKFVKMNNSALTMSKRKSASSGLNFANIVRGGSDSAVSGNNSEVFMDKQQEEYVLSSINEYMNLLDDEKTASSRVLENPQELSRAIAGAEQELAANSRSRVTNPMASQRRVPFAKASKSDVNGLTIKSNYSIDSNRSIYMVDMDGISAIIGKIGEEIFVLKKFESIINKPLQVRLDYGNTYIVRVGSFKCLVDVTEDKMGTLLEI